MKRKESKEEKGGVKGKGNVKKKEVTEIKRKGNEMKRKE